MSRWRVRARSVPKQGESPWHNKDRAAFHRPRRGRLLIALADGATQAYRADEWAELLVDAWAAQSIAAFTTNRDTAAKVSRLSALWRAGATPADDAPWYVAAKAERGSFSTLLGVDVRLEGHRWRWVALAVGDTNLFVLDGAAQLTASYPVARSAAFNSAPPLIGTTLDNPALAARRRLRRTGVLPPRGALVGATDALAKCLLVAHEVERPLWSEAISAARSAGAFSSWIEGLRDHGRLDDDDTTLLVAERI